MPSFRSEIKFILSDIEVDKLLCNPTFLRFFNNVYPDRQIKTLYFDTENFTYLNDNLSGISKRQKFRLRIYEKPLNKYDESFFEVKIRNNSYNWKYRHQIQKFKLKDVRLGSTDFYNFFYKELNYNEYTASFFEKPHFITLANSYLRSYFETINGIRLTVDKKLNFNGLHMDSMIWADNTINEQYNVVEIKYEPSMKNVVSNLCRTFSLKQVRHSKYVKGLSYFKKFDLY